MKKRIISAMVASIALSSVALGQSTTASGVINVISNVSGVYTYDISLTNTGSTGIGTLWYSWNPGQNYLPTLPSSTSSPAGWVAAITNDGATDGYGIRWTGGSIASGGTLSGFRFSTTDTPAILAGNTSLPAYPNQPVGDSFVYEGGPFSGGSDNFLINPVPEPMPVLLLGSLGAFALMRRKH